MHDSHDGAHPSAAAAGTVLVALTISNVVTNRWLPASAQVPWNLSVATSLVWLARSCGHTAEDLGLDTARLKSATKVGAIGSAAVGAGYAALLTTGSGDRLLSDRRLAGLSTRDTLWHLLVQIPLGTVLLEEIAFRAVLPCVLQHPRHPRWAPPLLTSVLFGLWHLLPAREEASANRAAMGRHMALTVVSTAAAGGILHRLRARAGHLAAPIALHFATNALGLLAVRRAHTRR